MIVFALVRKNATQFFFEPVEALFLVSQRVLVGGGDDVFPNVPGAVVDPWPSTKRFPLLKPVDLKENFKEIFSSTFSNQNHQIITCKKERPLLKVLQPHTALQ